jgi:hypothetical protein
MVANDGFGNTETDSLFVFGNAAAAMSIWKAGGYDTYGVEDVGTWFVRNSLTTANLLLLNDPDNYDFSHPTNSPLAELFGEHHDLMPWTPMGSDFSVRRPLVALCQPLQYQIDRVLSYPSRVSGRVVSPPSRPSGRVKCYSLRSSGRVYVE